MLTVTRFLLRPLPVPVLTKARERIAAALRRRRTDHVGMLVASVPWQLRSSEGVEERFDGPTAGSVRLGQ